MGKDRFGVLVPGFRAIASPEQPWAALYPETAAHCLYDCPSSPEPLSWLSRPRRFMPGLGQGLADQLFSVGGRERE
eukprot:2062865-Rhodomonas_salina.2